MAREHEGEVGRFDTVAVVDDANDLRAALFEIDVDARRAGVDRVFDQFLDHARRPFNDFAGRDLGDNRWWELSNPRHWPVHSPSEVWRSFFSFLSGASAVLSSASDATAMFPPAASSASWMRSCSFHAWSGR